MTNHLSDVQLPDNMPQLSEMRRGILQTFTPDQFEAIAAWLGMESLELADGEEVFQLGKRALSYAGILRSMGDRVDHIQDLEQAS